VSPVAVSPVAVSPAAVAPALPVAVMARPVAPTTPTAAHMPRPGGTRPRPPAAIGSAPAPVGVPPSVPAVPLASPRGTTEPFFGHANPELNALYADVLVMEAQKNGPLPQAVKCLSGDQMTMNELHDICELPETQPHPMHRFNVAPTTAKAHRRIIRWLMKHVPRSDASLDVAIPRAVMHMAATLGWLPTSLLTKLNTIHGALSALFLYREKQVHIAMGRCPSWKATIKTVQHLKPIHQPNQPKAATEAQVMEAIAKEPRPEVRAGLEVGYLTAARGGDIRQVLAKDINFPPVTEKQPTATMLVTFRRGKTASRDQYVVGAPLPSPETLAFIRARQLEGSWAFPGLDGKSLLTALRRVHSSLEQRSLRRGRLQHLAGQGWTDAQLIEVSRHASIPMLRRYLDMGVVSATTRETAVRAATSSASS